jgi:transposase-like protein
VRYRLSYAEVSEWLAERGILVDQSTIYRPVIIDMIVS